MRASLFLTSSLFRTQIIRQLTFFQRNPYSSAVTIHGENPQELITGKDPQYNHDNSRLLRVSVIGVPNAGKSTLVNRIINHDVCPVSKKAHTTRKSQKAMYLEDNTQIVFMDTPGLVNDKEAKKFEFIKDFILGPERAVRGADLLAVVHDVRNPALRNKLDRRILNVLKKFPEKQSILILNKVDTLGSKRKLLETVKFLTNEIVGNQRIPVRERGGPGKQRFNTSEILMRAKNRMRSAENASEEVDQTDAELNENESDSSAFMIRPEANARLQSGGMKYEEREEVTGWSNFQEIFMVSAIEGDGIEQLTDYFVKIAKDAPWDFNEEVLTDCAPQELAVRIVKSQLLEHLSDEIPYLVIPALEYWEEDNTGITQIVMTLDCPNERFVKIVIGKAGGNINVITDNSEKIIAKLLRRPVDLQLRVTCKKAESKGAKGNTLPVPALS